MRTIIGSTIFNYRVEALIAKGGMSQVYKARDLELDRLVAIKLIGIDTVSEPVFAQRLAREARTVASLRHPNIVQIHHKGEIDDMTYLVIEYVNGPTLAQILQSVFKQGGRLDYHAILTITGSITSALDYAHARGVIHRDIKPSNIMVDMNGMVYLTDFGLALRMIEGTEGKAFGSPHYISPEQINSSASVTARSDIYSLGVLTFRMLTGKLPFYSKKAMQVVMMHISSPVPDATEYNPALSPQVNDVLQRAMAKDPSQRYETCDAFQKDLATALGIDHLGEPMYQPRFLNSTWTRVHFTSGVGESTFAEATHLLDEFINSVEQDDDEDGWFDVDSSPTRTELLNND